MEDILNITIDILILDICDILIFKNGIYDILMFKDIYDILKFYEG